MQMSTALALSPEASAAMGRLMDNRGAILIAFAQVEWFLAKVIVEASNFDQYKAIDFSFSQDAEKRAERVKKILNVDGPFSPYSGTLIKAIDEVMTHIPLRTMSAHGLMVRPDTFELSARLHFRMYRMFKGGNLQELNLTMKEYTDQSSSLTTAARQFVNVVRNIWKDLNLDHLDPE
jgi:hypothetical protein